MKPDLQTAEVTHHRTEKQSTDKQHKKTPLETHFAAATPAASLSWGFSPTLSLFSCWRPVI